MAHPIRMLATLCAALLLLSACDNADHATETPAWKPDTEERKMAYSLGVSLGRQLHEEGYAIDTEAMSHGIADAVSGAGLRLSDQQLADAMQQLQKLQQQRLMDEQRSAGERNRAEAEAFLAKNADAEGVQTTASGLQYKVLVAGTGPKPTADDSVTVHYRGTLLDGTEFDSSYQRGEPITFPVSGVIQGWVEALQLMPTGSKWTLYIPSDLAYGESGPGGLIGPNAMLVFDVELLGVNGGETPPVR